MDTTSSLTEMDWLSRLKPKPSGPQEQKPPYSYSNLITFALSSVTGKEKKMTLAEIYKWIEDNFPYYRGIGSAWKNSIRHNLTLSKCFMKVARTAAEPGKGSFWTFDPSADPEDMLNQSREKGKSLKHALKKSSSEAPSEGGSETHSLASSSSSNNVSRLASTDPSASFLLSSSLTGFGVLEDMSASFKQFCQQLNSSDQQQQQQQPQQQQAVAHKPTFTIDTIESLMGSLRADKGVFSSLDPHKFQLTESLLLNVKDESINGEWTSAPHFPILAQSLNALLEGTGFVVPVPDDSLNAAFAVNLAQPPSTTTTTTTTSTTNDEKPPFFNADDEDEFDWNSIL